MKVASTFLSSILFFILFPFVHARIVYRNQLREKNAVVFTGSKSTKNSKFGKMMKSGKSSKSDKNGKSDKSGKSVKNGRKSSKSNKSDKSGKSKPGKSLRDPKKSKQTGRYPKSSKSVRARTSDIHPQSDHYYQDNEVSKDDSYNDDIYIDDTYDDAYDDAYNDDTYEASNDDTYEDNNDDIYNDDTYDDVYNDDTYDDIYDDGNYDDDYNDDNVYPSDDIETTTKIPTKKPTSKPTTRPTNAPIMKPTMKPTVEPTVEPTLKPTMKPILSPTDTPTASPTYLPTVFPTYFPTKEGPTPTNAMTLSTSPTKGPTKGPSHAPMSNPIPTPANLRCNPSGESTIFNILSKISHPDKLQDKSSPQRQALDWILNLDPSSSSLSCQFDTPNKIQELTHRYILSVFYHEMEGDAWVDCGKDDDFCGVMPDLGHYGKKPWLSNEKACDWAGIECSDEFWIRSIRLPMNNLVGRLSKIESELSKLIQLRELVLNDNRISGNFPKHLGGDGDTIFRINLSNNSMSGDLSQDQFPKSKLISLKLFGNQFTGSINWLAERKGLRQIDLRNNDFSGEVSNEFGELTSLAMFRIENNPKLSGNMPPAVCDLREDPSTKLLQLTASCKSSSNFTCSCCTKCY